jgi:lantibiotic modifying enzyme
LNAGLGTPNEQFDAAAIECRFGAAGAAIAEEVWRARYSVSGGLAWSRIDASVEGLRLTRQKIGAHVYDGTLGLAVLFAACARVLNEGAWKDRSLSVVEPIRLRFHEWREHGFPVDEMPNLGLGGVKGLGSIIYGLSTVGRLLSRIDLVEEAASIAGAITWEQVQRDRWLDVVLGSAGCLLVLELLLEHAGLDGRVQAVVQAAATACAERLISAQMRGGRAEGGWVTLQGFPELSGLAHGAAGMAWALARYFARSGDEAALCSIRLGLAFEDRCFRTDVGNWVDLRHQDADHFECGWCYGAPGMAVALEEIGRRVGGSLSIDLASRVAIALRTGASLLNGAVDHLCCGNFGRIEILHEMSRRCGLEWAQVAAVSGAGTLLREGGFRWRAVPGLPCWDPAFFTGASGVAYSLLRLGYPGRLPCILGLGW